MQASWIFSSNDVIANVGVILAGVLVLDQTADFSYDRNRMNSGVSHEKTKICSEFI